MIINVVVLIPMCISFVYVSGKWNKWKRALKRGSASKEDFVEAVKASGISGVILAIGFLILWLNGSLS